MPTSDYRLGYTSENTEFLPIQLSIKGEIPQWLSGNLIRNGPAKFNVGNKSFRHWFDGLAMLHKFAFSQGEVIYSSKFICSDAYTKSLANGRISSNEFATNKETSWLDRLKKPFQFEGTDNANINVCKLNGQYLAMTETPQPITFDLSSLDTIGKFIYKDKLNVQLSTAHPHLYSKDGTIFNIATHLGAFSKYIITKIQNDSNQRIPVATIAANKPAYIHSFGLTEKYLVLVEQPFRIDPLELLFSGKPYIENYHWYPEESTNFHLVDLSSGNTIGPITSEPSFFFHQVNAYEKGQELIIDLLAYPDPSIIQSLYLANLLAGRAHLQAAKFHRYIINPQTRQCREEMLFADGLELPTINYKQYNAQNYRYAYALSQGPDSPYLDRLMKLDLTNNSSCIWQQDACYPGEAIFIPHPSSTHEDNGLLLSVVLDSQQKKSFLLILDANNMQELAQVALPNIIPFGLHGQFWRNENV